MTIEERVRKFLGKYVALPIDDEQKAIDFVFNKYPGSALIIYGERGTGKTFLADILRTLSGKVVVDSPGMTRSETLIMRDENHSVGIAMVFFNAAMEMIGARDWFAIRLDPRKDLPVLRHDELREMNAELIFLGNFIARLQPPQTRNG